MSGQLRVLVVDDDAVVPAAVARAIDRVAAAPLEHVGVQVRPRRSPARQLVDGVSLVDRVERLIFRPEPDAMTRVDLRRSWPTSVDARTSSLHADQPDVVLDLTTQGMSPGRDGVPRLGVWSLRYGAQGRRLDAGAFARDFLSGADTGVCELVVEPVHGQPPAPGRVLYRSVSAVDRLSPARTRNQAAWKSAEFPARVLTALATKGAVCLPDLPPSPATNGRRHGVGGAAVAATILERGLREGIRRVGRRPEWFVAVRTGMRARPGDRDFDTRGFQALAAPPGRFYADPFVVSRLDGGAHVFVEDGPVDGGPARISVLALDGDGRQQEPARVALERSSHLSYPFVFQDDRNWYLLPETAETGAVELLRAIEFPWRWESCGALLNDVRAWDPTLIRCGGHYWLFVTIAAPGARPSDELWLYSAPALTGPWRPHPANPVVSDARRARPAGRIIERGGSLLRPAQDGSGAYGRRIVLNRIDALTPDEYSETPSGSIEPGWLPGVERTHTYTADAGFEVIDGLRYRRRPWPDIGPAYGRPSAR